MCDKSLVSFPPTLLISISRLFGTTLVKLLIIVVKNYLILTHGSKYFFSANLLLSLVLLARIRTSENYNEGDKHMDKICKRCGLPIKVNKDMGEVFEGMHWLCFHLEFEHGDYDPDEPCDDPSCPWNRISGDDILIINSHSDIKILSSNNKSGIFINKKEIELHGLPRIRCEVTIHDEYLGSYVKNVWLEEEQLHVFQNQTRSILDVGKGKAVIKAISEEEFCLKIINVDKFGHIAAIYKVKSYKYIQQERIYTYFENGFEIEFSTLEKLVNNITTLFNLLKGV